MRKASRARRRVSRISGRGTVGRSRVPRSRSAAALTRTAAGRASALLFTVLLVFAVLTPSSHAGTPLLRRGGDAVRAHCGDSPASCGGTVEWLYRYSYSTGFHPFTSAHDVRRQLTDNFWLFPVSGACPARIEPGDECDLLGGNPVRVEAVGADELRIATLPGHGLGEGLHIRFAFTRSLGFHYLDVSAWQDRPTWCTEGALCGAAGRAGAWVLWKVLSATLAVSAYAA